MGEEDPSLEFFSFGAKEVFVVVVGCIVMSCNLPNYTKCESGISMIWIPPKKEATTICTT